MIEHDAVHETRRCFSGEHAANHFLGIVSRERRTGFSHTVLARFRAAIDPFLRTPVGSAM